MAALYTSAVSILDKILKKKGTLKTLVIENGFSNKKKLYALVCETLKYRNIIEEILEITKLRKHEKQLKHSLALVLVYECLFGQGLKCGGKFKQILTRNKSSLNSALARIKVKAKVTNNADLLPKKALAAAMIPRYVRVNLLLTTVDDVIKVFSKEGYVLKPSPENQKKGDKTVYKDPHIHDVLVFPPGTDLHNHPLYIKGHIILQDKASCLPAHILNPSPGSLVIDGCAAPGNKTSHLASRMNNTGHIYAFDTDSQRLQTMKKLMSTAGVICATMKNMSFLKVNPKDKEYNKVDCILLDPSCSGSGIVGRMDSCTDQPEEEDFKQRLESLSQFQLSAVQHALSFPSVKRVVYSTCSIHQKENEDVVHQALKKFDGEFELAGIMASWEHRGLPVFPEAHKCIRASPETTKTNGFFVALFTRTKNSTTYNNTTGQLNSNIPLDSQISDHTTTDAQNENVMSHTTLKRKNNSKTTKAKKRRIKKEKLSERNNDAISEQEVGKGTTDTLKSKEGTKKKRKKKKVKSVVSK